MFNNQAIIFVIFRIFLIPVSSGHKRSYMSLDTFFLLSVNRNAFFGKIMEYSSYSSLKLAANQGHRTQSTLLFNIFKREGERKEIRSVEETD